MKDVLFIIPPLMTIEVQSLAAHILQACAREAGFSFDIDYLNMEFAALLGEKHNEFCKMNYFLLGERAFAKAAWGDRVSNQFDDSLYKFSDIYPRDKNPVKFFSDSDDLTREELKEVEELALKWVDGLRDRLRDLPYSLVGITSSFEQNNAAIAILKLIKELNPGITTFIGGFNCEKKMANGIISLDPDSEFIDYIFSGESEISLVNFITNFKSGISGGDRVIYQKPLMDLDLIPNLDYRDYFTKLKEFFPDFYKDKGRVSLAMETSRGCWWGEKSQCTFCGTSERVKFRQKSLNRILNEIEAAKKWDINYLHMADLIMPEEHLTGLLPTLLDRGEKWNFYFEEKASLSLEELKLLKEAGVNDIQPGIETLSTDILKKMAKGSSKKQNIRFLRDATSVGLNVFWNIVWGIPGESIEDYKKMNSLIPKLFHLTPPLGLFHMTMVRFSPYFNNPEKYGITDIEPIPSYKKVYPDGANTDDLAIVYSCRYHEENIEDESEIERLSELIATWNQRWISDITKPRLLLTKQGDGEVIILDTRGVNSEMKIKLNEKEIDVLTKRDIYKGLPEQNWALEKSYVIEEGGELLPLVTTDKELI